MIPFIPLTVLANLLLSATTATANYIPVNQFVCNEPFMIPAEYTDSIGNNFAMCFSDPKFHRNRVIWYVQEIGGPYKALGMATKKGHNFIGTVIPIEKPSTSSLTIMKSHPEVVRVSIDHSFGKIVVNPVDGSRAISWVINPLGFKIGSLRIPETCGPYLKTLRDPEILGPLTGADKDAIVCIAQGKKADAFISWGSFKHEIQPDPLAIDGGDKPKFLSIGFVGSDRGVSIDLCDPGNHEAHRCEMSRLVGHKRKTFVVGNGKDGIEQIHPENGSAHTTKFHYKHCGDTHKKHKKTEKKKHYLKNITSDFGHEIGSFDDLYEQLKAKTKKKLSEGLSPSQKAKYQDLSAKAKAIKNSLTDSDHEAGSLDKLYAKLKAKTKKKLSDEFLSHHKAKSHKLHAKAKASSDFEDNEFSPDSIKTRVFGKKTASKSKDKDLSEKIDTIEHSLKSLLNHAKNSKLLSKFDSSIEKNGNEYEHEYEHKYKHEHHKHEQHKCHQKSHHIKQKKVKACNLQQHPHLNPLQAKIEQPTDNSKIHEAGVLYRFKKTHKRISRIDTILSHAEYLISRKIAHFDAWLLRQQQIIKKNIKKFNKNLKKLQANVTYNPNSGKKSNKFLARVGRTIRGESRRIVRYLENDNDNKLDNFDSTTTPESPKTNLLSSIKSFAHNINDDLIHPVENSVGNVVGGVQNALTDTVDGTADVVKANNPFASGDSSDSKNIVENVEKSLNRAINSVNLKKKKSSTENLKAEIDADLIDPTKNADLTKAKVAQSCKNGPGPGVVNNLIDDATGFVGGVEKSLTDNIVVNSLKSDLINPVKKTFKCSTKNKKTKSKHTVKPSYERFDYNDDLLPPVRAKLAVANKHSAACNPLGPVGPVIPAVRNSGHDDERTIQEAIAYLN